MDSILTSIKNLLGINEECKDFDNEIIPHINTTFLTLQQIGVNMSSSYIVTSKSDTWQNVFGDVSYLDAIKTYVFLNVKMVFDPPSASTILESLKRAADTLEWRINVQAESPTEETMSRVDIANNLDDIIDIQDSFINDDV